MNQQKSGSAVTSSAPGKSADDHLGTNISAGNAPAQTRRALCWVEHAARFISPKTCRCIRCGLEFHLPQASGFTWAPHPEGHAYLKPSEVKVWTCLTLVRTAEPRASFVAQCLKGIPDRGGIIPILPSRAELHH